MRSNLIVKNQMLMMQEIGCPSATGSYLMSCQPIENVSGQ